MRIGVARVQGVKGVLPVGSLLTENVIESKNALAAKETMGMLKVVKHSPFPMCTWNSRILITYLQSYLKSQ
jgi:hypothetical protein